MFVQAEFGLMCPISVTDTSIHLIRKFASAELKDYLLPKMLSADAAMQWKGTQFMTMGPCVPGCVKSPTANLRVESQSRFRRCRNQLHCQPMPEEGK